MKNTVKTFFSACAMSAMLMSGAALIAPQTAQAEDVTITMSEDALGDFIQSYLFENPEAVVKALQEYDRQQKEQEQEAFQDKLSDYKDDLTNSDFPTVAGNANGDVTVIEFFDYNCGYCKRGYNELQTLLDQDKNVRVILQEYPILSESSVLASKYALAASKQDKYFEFHVALMEYSGAKTEEILIEKAEDIGLDIDQLKKDAHSEAVKAEINRVSSIARDLGIRGTPAFIIGDYMAPGYMTVDQMKQVIADHRENQD